MSAALELNHCTKFNEAMAEAGLITKSLPIDDGQLHRFRVDGDKSGSENGWYVLYPGDVPAGAFGCWKRGINETWCSKSRSSMTPEERQAFEAKLHEMRQQRKQEEERKHEEAALKCLSLWESARPTVSADHPYLRAKQIRPYGLKQLQNNLLVPMRDGKASWQACSLLLRTVARSSKPVAKEGLLLLYWQADRSALSV